MALKAPIASGVVPPESIDMGLAEALVETARYIDSLSLETIDNKILLLSCLLINSLSEKDVSGAKNLAEFLTEILTPKQAVFFRYAPTSALSNTELSKERWGLDPALLKIKH